MHLGKNRALALLSVLALAACSGDNGAKGEKGDTGAKGDTGTTGPQGPQGPAGSGPDALTERCGGCHQGALAETHKLSRQLGVKVTGPAIPNTKPTEYYPEPTVAISANGADVTMTFIITVNGAGAMDFTQKASLVRRHNEDAWWYYDTAQQAGVRAKLPSPWDDPTAFTFTTSQNGTVVVTFKGLAAAARAGAKYMVSLMAPDGVTATAVGTYLPADATNPHDVVSSQACINCHGQLVWGDAAHDVTYPQGVGPCIVCHNRPMTSEKPTYPPTDRLFGMIHGIHNSKAMPGGVYTFTWTNGNQAKFTIGFPGNMNNCATCHTTPAQLDQVKNAPVSYALCISCHGGWDGFSRTKVGAALDFHQLYTAATPTTACAACHDDKTAPATIAAFHNGLITERAGLIWDGADQSVVLAAKYQLEITGVTVSATDVKVTWTAKNPLANTAYDPCNQDIAKGPVFFGYSPAGVTSEGCTYTTVGCASSTSLLRAYATGDDWVADQYPDSTSPGQPKSTNLTTKNTTCADGVATSVLPLQTFPAGAAQPTRGIVALQGKPQEKWTDGNVIWVRAQSPTREFMVADGSLPTTQRRVLVDIEKCKACHLGTVYQHGGSRVDKIELCVMCHNPASSEQNNRVKWGITEETAYDGKSGETYDLRTMIHAQHSGGESGAPLVYYRSNGVFFFGLETSLPDTWPPKATPDKCVTCYDNEDGWLTWCAVYGSTTSGKVKKNVNGMCEDGDDSTQGMWLPHRFRSIEYPRPLNDCYACHVAGTVDRFPDPAKALAVTYETGASQTWNNLLDDVVIGPSAASCMTCHQSGDALRQFQLRQHAYDNGWWPQAFGNGRQTLIDAFQGLLTDADVP